MHEIKSQLFVYYLSWLSVVCLLFLKNDFQLFVYIHEFRSQLFVYFLADYYFVCLLFKLTFSCLFTLLIGVCFHVWSKSQLFVYFLPDFQLFAYVHEIKSQLFVYFLTAVCLLFSWFSAVSLLFKLTFSCLFTFWQLFVYMHEIKRQLFVYFLADFQLFVYIIDSCLFTCMKLNVSCVFTFLLIFSCLCSFFADFKLFVYFFCLLF